MALEALQGFQRAFHWNRVWGAFTVTWLVVQLDASCWAARPLVYGSHFSARLPSFVAWGENETWKFSSLPTLKWFRV